VTLAELEVFARAQLSRFEFRRAPFPIRLSLASRSGSLELLVVVDVPDRDTGEPITVRHAWPIPALCSGAGEDAGDVLPCDFHRFVLERVDAAVLHELDEAVHIDGARARPTHPTPRHTVHRFR
jgi:hypothetical protein